MSLDYEPGALAVEVKWLGFEADHLLPNFSGNENMWISAN
jgi:hypothetical protein